MQFAQLSSKQVLSRARPMAPIDDTNTELERVLSYYKLSSLEQ